MRYKSYSLLATSALVISLAGCGGGSGSKGAAPGSLPADADKQEVAKQELSGLWLARFDISAAPKSDLFSGSVTTPAVSILQISRQNDQYVIASCAGEGIDPSPLVIDESGKVLFSASPARDGEETLPLQVSATNEENTKLTYSASGSDLGSFPIIIEDEELDEDVAVNVDITAVSMTAYKIRDDISASIGSVTIDNVSHELYCMDFSWPSASASGKVEGVSFSLSQTGSHMSFSDLDEQGLEFSWSNQTITAAGRSFKSSDSELHSTFSGQYFFAEMPSWVSIPNLVSFEYLLEGQANSYSGGLHDISLDIDILKNN